LEILGKEEDDGGRGEGKKECAVEEAIEKKGRKVRGSVNEKKRGPWQEKQKPIGKGGGGRKKWKKES